MIICPTCKEEIDNDSHFCDQCGQALLFCDRCGNVGIGRRCTQCGGLMVAPDDNKKASDGLPGMSESLKMDTSVSARGNQQQKGNGIPVLTLANDSLNIRVVGINGAIIGRRTGPYSHFFEKYPYVSGTHAQLKYAANTGWCIADKHSSNGTKLNQRTLQPDVDMSLSNGDILTIANINLQVIVR
ncbi:MAG: FHA domain-containing protein [Prevotella sp.]|jgi:hypothetical protein|nr:FHA domain-containing protein [Prevotella sp.]MBO7537669.1 FHA domain-containing protein [Prevotella sp.]